MSSPSHLPDVAARKAWMGTLARAHAGAIASLLEAAPALPAFTALRRPEAGLVMLRGRAGGDGAAFNLGEATVTRCSVRDEAGRVGHAYVMGRAVGHAELAARLDAVLQDAALHEAYRRAVIAPLAAAEAARARAAAAKAAGTEVKFFTLATMRS